MPKVSGATRTTTVETVEPVTATQPNLLDLPASPEDQNFWDWMAETKVEEWEKKSYYCYIYRLEPPAGKVTGEPAYLNKFVRPFTVEEIQAEFGGGKYSYWMKEGNTKALFRGNFRIAGDPKNPGATVTTTDAGGLTPILTKFAEELNKARNSGADATTATKQAMEILTTAYKTGLETVSKGSESPKLTEIIAAVSQLQGMAGANKATSPMDALMVKALEHLLNPPDPMKNFEAMMALADRLNGGGNRGGDWRMELARNLPQVAGQLKEMAATFGAAMQATRGAGALPAQPPPAGVPMPAQTPMTPTATGHGPLPLEPLGNPTTGEAPMPQASSPDEAWIKQKIAQMILQGCDGEEIGAWLDVSAPAVVDALKQYTVEQLFFFFSTDPFLRVVPQDDNLKKVLAAFLRYASEEQPPAAAPLPN